MKNLVFKFSITSVLMSFTLVSFAFEITGAVDVANMLSDNHKQKATECQAAIKKTENNEELNEQGLQAQYDELIGIINEFEQNENSDTLLSNGYMATICAHQANQNLQALPENEEDKPCTDLAKQDNTAEPLKEISNDFNENSRKIYAASYFCKHKANMMVGADLYRQAKAQTAGDNDHDGPVDEYALKNVAKALEEKTKVFLGGIPSLYNEQGLDSHCKNMFLQTDIRDESGSVTANNTSVENFFKGLKDFKDKGDNSPKFLALLKAYKDGVPALQRGLQVTKASQCTKDYLKLGDEQFSPPLGVPGLATYQQPLFIYKSTDRFSSKVADEGQNANGLMDRLCVDHVRNYCIPQLNFYSKCQDMADTTAHAKEACKAMAFKSFVSCAGEINNNNTLWNLKIPGIANDHTTQEYVNFFQPQVVNGTDISNLDLEDYIDGIKKRVTSENEGSSFINFGQSFNEYFEGNGESRFGALESETGMSQKTAQNKFHDFYGMCIVYRWASMKNLNDEDGVVPVGEKVNSVNGRYSCSLSTPWAADYRFCLYAVMWADGFPDILSIAGQTGMAIHGAVKTEQAMTTAQVEGMEGDPTAAMGIQAQQLKNRAASHWSTSGLDTLTATGAMTAYGMYPKPKKLKKGCSGGDDPVYIDAEIDCGMYYAYYNNWIEGGSQSNSDASLYPNRKIKDEMLMKAIQKFGSGIMNGLMAYEYDKQVGMLEKFREGAQEFYEDPEMNFPSDPAEQASYCQRFPTIRSCRGGSRRGDGVQGGINFAGGSQQGQNGSSFGFESNGAGEFFVDENIDAGEKKAIADLKDVIGNTTRNKFGDDFDAPGAGKGSLNSGGGGGAISGSAGGGGGGGGGAGGGSKGAGPSGQTGPRKIATKFSNGSADSFSFKSGGSDSKSKSKNPFASLVGKKNRKVASKIVDDIGPKKSQLFEKISNAYSKAKKDNRLIIINQD